MASAQDGAETMGLNITAQNEQRQGLNPVYLQRQNERLWTSLEKKKKVLATEREPGEKSAKKEGGTTSVR